MTSHKTIGNVVLYQQAVFEEQAPHHVVAFAPLLQERCANAAQTVHYAQQQQARQSRPPHRRCCFEAIVDAVTP